MKKLQVLILMVLTNVACQQASDQAFHYTESSELLALGDVSSEMEVTEHSVDATQPAPQMKSVSQQEQVNKKVIKSGAITFESEHVEADYRQISELLPQFQAYIENENETKSSYEIRYHLIIRVPAPHYDSLYNRLSSLAFHLDERYSTIEDVTDRYYDLKSRITNKKALETRYQELLSKTSSITEILEIEKNLNDVRTEIEHMEGQFKYLSQQISYSSLQLNFYENLPYSQEGPQRKHFGARLTGALGEGWQYFLNFLVGLSAIWPFILITTGGIWLIIKWRKRRKTSR